MARIDDLLLRVADAQLRADLISAVAELNRTNDFGLVFESHLPEICKLPSHPIREGVKVSKRSSKDDSLYVVASIEGLTAKVVLARDAAGVAVSTDDQELAIFSTSDLVVMAEFGDPIFPGLKRLGSVDRGVKSQPPLSITVRTTTFWRHFNSRTQAKLTASISIRRTTQVVATGSTTTTT